MYFFDNFKVGFFCFIHAKFVIDLFEIDINATNNSGETALQWACVELKKAKVVKVIVEAGADVNECGRYRKSPLLGALDNAGVEIDEIAEFLIENGAISWPFSCISRFKSKRYLSVPPYLK